MWQSPDERKCDIFASIYKKPESWKENERIRTIKKETEEVGRGQPKKNSGMCVFVILATLESLGHQGKSSNKILSKNKVKTKG
jgi:hypothetical protein